MRTCATWRPGRVATGATRISRDWRRDASRHRWVRSPSDNCHSTCSKQAKGSLSLCLSQSSTKLALQIPFGLLNSPAGSSAEFPQIVLQSVCRFRVIFELVSSCSAVVRATFVRAQLSAQLLVSFRFAAAAGKKQIENEQKLIMAHSGSPTLTWRCCYRLDWAQGSDALIIFAMQCFLFPPSSFPQWKYLLIGHHWFSWECLDFNRILLIFLNGLSSTWF